MDVHTLRVILGDMPPLIESMVVEWARCHYRELVRNSALMLHHQRPLAIEPMVVWWNASAGITCRTAPVTGSIKNAFGYRDRERFKVHILFHLGGLDLYPSRWNINRKSRKRLFSRDSLIARPVRPFHPSLGVPANAPESVIRRFDGVEVLFCLGMAGRNAKNPLEIRELTRARILHRSLVATAGADRDRRARERPHQQLVSGKQGECATSKLTIPLLSLFSMSVVVIRC